MRTGLEVVERLGLERQRDIVLRQRRRAQRLLQFGVKRQPVARCGRSGFAPTTEALDDDGSSSAGAVFAGGNLARRSPLSVRSTFGKSEAW